MTNFLIIPLVLVSTAPDTAAVDGQAVVLMDFAENYSFLCQDAVQGFHWDTSQAPLHFVAVYYRDNCDSLSCKLQMNQRLLGFFSQPLFC